MRAAAPPWEPPFVPRGTALETVRCLSSPTRSSPEVGRQPPDLQTRSSGVPRVATCGDIMAVAIIRFAIGRGGELVAGSTSSQVGRLRKIRAIIFYSFREDLSSSWQFAPWKLDLTVEM